MNTDIAMMGHEWMEMIVRVSGALYRKDEPDGNLGTCVERFLGDMKRNLPRLAQHNPDEYRSHRLYSEDVHYVFDPPGRLKRGEGLEHKDILKAIFTCYSMYNLGKKHRKGMKKAAVPVFGMDTWNRMLTDSGFFVVSTMKRQDCKLVFLDVPMKSIGTKNEAIADIQIKDQRVHQNVWKNAQRASDDVSTREVIGIDP